MSALKRNPGIGEVGVLIAGGAGPMGRADLVVVLVSVVVYVGGLARRWRGAGERVAFEVRSTILRILHVRVPVVFGFIGILILFGFDGIRVVFSFVGAVNQGVTQ